MKRNLVVTLLALCSWLCAGFSLAAENAVLAGRITDADGKPVAGVRVQVFDSKQTRRPADFMSEKSAADGGYRVTAPAGSYWAVAVLRASGADFGPLRLDDRHSGEPTAVTLAPGKTLEKDFTVFGLREAAKRLAKENSGLARVSGRVLDARQRPVPGVYVMADRKEKIGEFPDYLSGWTGKDGGFEIFLPAGGYHFGSTADFPPAAGQPLPLAITVGGNAEGVVVTSERIAPEPVPDTVGPEGD